MTEQPLREAFSALAATTRPTPACPSPEVWWSVLRLEVAAAERRRLLQHLVTCAYCTEAWRLGRTIASEAGLEAPERPVDRLPKGWRKGVRPWGLAVAAAALVVLAVLQVSHLPNGDVVREPPEPVLRSLLAPGEPLPRDDFVLRWRGPAQARFLLRVATEDLRPLVVVRDLETPEYRVDPELLSGLAPGARVVWQVEAVSPDGSRASSPTFVSVLE